MRRKSTYRRNQRGVALLFALGVLSLLLVMGLAFVANSLLAQKVASNNSSRSQAKMLAQSAISRMAMSVMYYQYAAAHPQDFANLYQSFVPQNYMDVHSYYDLSDSANVDHKTSPAATGELLGDDSKLIPGILLTDYDMKNPDNQKAEWSYITAKAKVKNKNGDEEEKDKLIGRVAYQQIPTTSTAQINLDHNLQGVYLDGTPARIPWEVRIGEDINELNLDETTVLNAWKRTHAPLDKADMNASTFDAFFNAYASSIFNTSKEEKEKWLKRWFVDGSVPADPEFYIYEPSGQPPQYLHRFNLGALDGGEPADDWYGRLNGVAEDEKNSALAVEALASNSVEFRTDDKLTPQGVGLPFLKLIGSSRGTFADIADRRRQITANLNDYCDGDSIPTSNVKAGEWKNRLTASGDWPKYTGNEKTPYINELAFGFKITPSLTKGSGLFASYDLAVNLKLDRAELIAELIKIYKDLVNKYGEKEEENFSDYELYAHLKSLKLEFGVTVKGTVKYTVESAGSTSTPLELTDDPQLFEYSDQTVKLEFNKDVPGELLSKWPDDGYRVHAVQLTAPASSEVKFDFSTQFANKLPSGAMVTSATIDEVKIEVTSAKFKLGGIVLMDTHDAANSFGVDFVRWEDDSTDGIPEANPSLTLFSNASVPGRGSSGSGWIAGSSLGSIPEGYRYFYLGGMEAKDPRQNLNAKYTASVTKKEETDWSLPDSIKLVDFDNAYPAEVMSIKMADKPEEVTGDNVAARLVAGKCNHDAIPNRKVAGDSNADECDAEFPTLTAGDSNLDPAWRGDGENEHLSTAYIRNAPMQSPWELGVIHRAMAWQTLNLKSAMRPGKVSPDATETAASTDPILNEDMRHPAAIWDGDGTSFAGGDGGLLEQIKMTDKAYCYGKLNVNMLSNDLTLNPGYTEWDDDMGRALFFNLRWRQSVGDLFADVKDSSKWASGADGKTIEATGTEITWDKTSTVTNPMKEAVDEFRKKYNKKEYEHAFENRAQFLAWKDSAGKCLANGFGIISDDEYEKLPDAQREEIVGKTINLLKGTNSVSNMIRFIVIAQTIRDMGNTTIARIRYDGGVATQECEYGKFDVIDSKDSQAGNFPKGFPENDKYLYFDEITGEVKLLVTMENNISTGQIIVRQIEYLE